MADLCSTIASDPTDRTVTRAGKLAPAADAHPELRRGALVDRYVVLARLGAGGMGVVYAAYDPELDRKVALKLLHPRLDADPAVVGEARARLVREAKALARLNHPHIVAVHDVGEHAGAVWLAMEYVDGETLSVWLSRRRGWREVLDVLTPAACGLAAAHEAGLVHRDIKPDNLMFGRDGRVRVMDLGLSRALGGAEEAALEASYQVGPREVAVTQVGTVMGTPAYMSPEQFCGEPADARSDVFSFCVTLWEALMGERPFVGATPDEVEAQVLAGRVRPVPREPLARRVPRWLRRMCVQGLAVRPERRFASMAALLAALEQCRAGARVRKWVAGAGAVMAVAAVTYAGRQVDRATRVAACAAAGAGITAVWNDEARAGVRAGLVATGVRYAPQTADHVLPFFDAQAEAWREHRTRVCMQADLEDTLDAERLDRAVWCLDERRMQLAALASELAHADALMVQRAVSAAAGLPPVSPCTDGQVLMALPSPPPVDERARVDEVRATLSRARSQHWAGDYPAALETSRAALADAEAIGWLPVIAAARQVEGNLLDRLGAYPESEAASLAAYMAAAKVRAWDVAAVAANDLAFFVGSRQGRVADGKVWAGHAEVAISLAGDPLGLREAHRLDNLGNVHATAGAYAEAEELHRRAAALVEQALGGDHPLVAICLNNLALARRTAGAYAEALALSRRVLAIREKALGRDHPLVAQALQQLALVHRATGAHAEAKPLFERALAIWTHALGPEHDLVRQTLHDLAEVEASLADAGGPP